MSPSNPENYTPGHSDNAVNFMARRTAETHAAFALPLFRPGQRILDCACGPGGITLGIARRVAPGETVGIDASSEDLARAREAANQAAVAVTFQEGDVYELTFSPASFDGVFAHALFEHLAEPSRALAQIRRVLKPGGFVALRSPDWQGFVLHPWNEAVSAALEGYKAIQQANGGDVYAGRKLASWLRQAGFRDVQRSASYELYESAAFIAEYLAQQLAAAGKAAEAETLRQWARDPDALFAQTWFEAVGFSEA